jgi:hypothetical protein
MRISLIKKLGDPYARVGGATLTAAGVRRRSDVEVGCSEGSRKREAREKCARGVIRKFTALPPQYRDASRNHFLASGFIEEPCSKAALTVALVTRGPSQRHGLRPPCVIRR